MILDKHTAKVAVRSDALGINTAIVSEALLLYSPDRDRFLDNVAQAGLPEANVTQLVLSYDVLKRSLCNILKDILSIDKVVEQDNLVIITVRLGGE